MKTTAAVYLDQVIGILKLVRKRLPRDPVTAGWYVRGVAEMLDIILYDVGLSVHAVRLLDAAFEAREKKDLTILIDELDGVINELESMLSETRRQRREKLEQLLKALSSQEQRDATTAREKGEEPRHQG